MRVGVHGFDGQRLKQARIARGLYKNKLAEAVGVTPQVIGKYEDGSHNPSIEVVNKLSATLRFNQDFFTTPARHSDVGLVFWRSRQSESKSAREKTEQRMGWAAELFEMFEEVAEFQTDLMPSVEYLHDFRFTTLDDVERLAMEVRTQLGFGTEPIRNMTLALENIGIPVVFWDVESDKQDGFQWFSERLDRQFVGINTRNSTACRVRFDLAHELAHILLHRAVEPSDARSPTGHKALEIQANYFAGAFLFPAESFYADVAYPSLDYFLSLKRKWGVSVSGMIERAFALDMIDKEERTDLHRKSSQRKWRGRGRQEPMDDELVVDRPRLFRKAFELLLNEGLTSRSSIRYTLPIPDEEIEQIIGLEPGELAQSFGENDKVRILPVRSRSSSGAFGQSGEVLEFKKD